MINKRVKISSVVENQLPAYVRDNYPLVGEFLSQYYTSLDKQSGAYDILQNIDQYIKLEELTSLVESTTLSSSVEFTDDTISVNSTSGFPDTYGLLKIGDEIITYTSKTNSTFEGCIRGFNGVTSYQANNVPDQLVFTETNIETHSNGDTVSNLSILFLKEFFKKVKKQFVPGFDERTLNSDLNQNLFIKQSKDFYSSKGTDESFEILFRALFGEDVETIKPQDYLFIPSDSQYRVTKDLVVRAIEGDPENLLNQTLYQDETDFLNSASGSVSKVEKITRGNDIYYVLSLDFGFNRDINAEGTTIGEFSIHSKTKVITPAEIGSDTLDVDSTVGFPESGELTAYLSNDTTVTFTYTSKSYTQFFGCSGIDQLLEEGQDIHINSFAYGYFGQGTDNIVKVLITGVLSDLSVERETKLYNAGDTISIKTLGKSEDTALSNSWIYNIASTYDVENITLVDSANFTYRVDTFDDTDFSIGDRVKFKFTDGSEQVSNVVAIFAVANDSSFFVTGQGAIDVTKKYQVQRVILKGDFSNYSELDNHSVNVQNTYVGLQNNSFYVTSNSLPSYLNEEIDVNDRSVTFSGTFSDTELNIGTHGFFTGDSVYYKPASTTDTLNITEGIYFVEKVNSTTVKIARSRSNLFKQKYLTVTGTVTDNKFELNSLANQSLDAQKIVRTFSSPSSDGKVHETESGSTGILVNGVEILNYKSRDSVFYGAIDNIKVLSPGEDYDVINPPLLKITDTVGTGATGFCEVVGSFETIDVIDGGFDYLNTPTINISGGGGSGAKAEANLFDVEHEVSFNSVLAANQVDLSNNTIGFSSFHKFRDAERVIYQPDGQQGIGGLTTSATYYVSVQDEFKVTLHNTETDAADGLNAVDLTSYGVGNHRVVSTNLKKQITSITITDRGQNYRNRKVSIPSSNINSYSDTIIARSHGYTSGDILVYSAAGTPASGLVNGNSYYITVVDENSFKLSSVGTSPIAKDFYYSTKQYINIEDSGSGYHSFNYEPITVTVDGVVGVSTRTGQDFSASVQSVVRGEVRSVFLEQGGSEYGAEEFINFNRQPSITLDSGSGAEVIPVILGGRIREVLVVSGGRNYNSPPKFEFSGPGYGCKLTPILVNGVLSEVKVVYGGTGYDKEKTIIDVIASGKNARFESFATQWNVNLVERLLQSNQVDEDDGILDTGLSSDYGLQYAHAYAPRKLRRTILSRKLVSGQLIFVPDLDIENSKEVESTSHSPIIGWAYDGNPIYGPYGFANIDGTGVARLMKSSYILNLDTTRPNTSTYPQGFFIEDYKYDASGDLDEYNGRFCITPEYPNGVYAYFTTINSATESSGVFRNYKKPVFPYFIGNEYKSVPIAYNFNPRSNQDVIDLNETSLLRNTKPYNFLREMSGYDYAVVPNDIRPQQSVVTYSSTGGVNSVGVITGGTGYKVGDNVAFDNGNTGGQNLTAVVKNIDGKAVNKISVVEKAIFGVEFTSVPQSQNTYIGFSSSPHELSNRDIVSITGLSTFGTQLSSSYTVGVRSDTFSLITGVGTAGATGIVTYFELYGSLTYPAIRENDILQVESEKVKVLNVDINSTRVRVERENDGTTGAAHTDGVLIYNQSRKFTFPVGINSNAFEYKLNRQLYFNPTEAVALGTSYGVGIGTTLSFANPGVGATTLFVPTRSVYLPNHKLETGDKLIYSANGETTVAVSTDGVSSFNLTENGVVYAARINDNLIGIATNRVGLGSTGNFVGIDSSVTTDILYFTGIGNGVIHSFKTNYDNVLTGEVNKNEVTVSTSSTHGLSFNDTVNVSCVTGVSTTFKVKYNDETRRLLIDPREFTAGNVTTSTNTVTISNHGYEDGQKVVHTATTPSGGLDDNGIYYIIKVDNDNFKLAENYYDATKVNPVVVDITSASAGEVSLINPRLFGYKNQAVVFDLSDQSLSYIQGSIRYSAFDFKFYTDAELQNSFETTQEDKTFNVIRTGSIGVSANAKVTINLDENVPDELFYTLEPVDRVDNSQTKLEYFNDSQDIINHNKILVSNSIYAGTYSISGVAGTTFKYSVTRTPEKGSYISSEATIKYSTSSKTATGPIKDVLVTDPGVRYSTLPGITSVISDSGEGAILTLDTETIGNIRSYEIQNIGFEYSVDRTLRPTAKLPQLLNISPFSSFDTIGITSVGRFYTIAPDLIAIDSVTNTVITDVDLKYDLGDSEVTILKNTKGINEVEPIIIPINNTNGVGINSMTFDSGTQEVTVGLAVSYSNASDYPFAVGDKVFIENTSVGIGSTQRGYNSSAYDYARFTLTAINPNIGGVNGTITYSLENYLPVEEDPGTFNLTYSSGIITPEKFFPIFDISLKTNVFPKGETVISGENIGVVEDWDNLNRVLKVSSTDSFAEGEFIATQNSKDEGFISSVEDYDLSYKVSSNSIVKQGSNTERGFLNNSFQRIHDSDYYQYFSYSLKSKIEYEDWNDAVSSMNHTAGFKKFSDLIIESENGGDFSGISTAQNEGGFSGLADLISVIDVECVNDFDLATEKTLTIGSELISDEIIFESSILQDYFESVGNRVLLIDDFSDLFNSEPRSTRFSNVGTFALDSANARKFITFVRDRRFTGERQIYLVTLLHDGTFGYINQYGRVDTTGDMGSFDFTVSGEQGVLQFYPVDFKVNNFDVSYVSYNLKDTVLGVGTTTLGNVIEIKTSNTTISSGSTAATTIVGIETSNTASKVLVEIAGTDGSYYEFNEVTVLHDGTTTGFFEYGQIVSSSDALSSSGIGTYYVEYSGSNINLVLTPTVGAGISYVVNTVQVSIANTTSTGIGTEELNTGILESFYTSIAASGSPSQSTIADYDNSTYGVAYYVVSVEDTTNAKTQVSEIVVADDGTNAYAVEFGQLYSDASLGTFDVGVSGSLAELYFTPNANIDIQVRVFQNAVGVVDDASTKNFIDLTSGSIDTGSGIYEGTDIDIKREFDLVHNGLPIFERYFDGSNVSIANTTTDRIIIPNHFFVTGEELTYSYAGAGTSQAIGIASTSIVGFGTTDKVPSTVYAVKIDDRTIKLAGSAEDALAALPTTFDLTSVGIGTSHRFIARKQNSRALISIDNVIQSPIVSTSVTSTLTKKVKSIDDTITISGITSIFNGDLLKIDDEIVKINSVGVGSTNSLLVQRSWMGTGLSTHALGSLVTRVEGDYNIVENRINFITAPYGPTPLSSSSNPPDSRDWSGIATQSTFSGRTFLRSGVVGATTHPYADNYVFDSIANNFTGVATEFTLKSDGVDVSGISTSNAIILVNQIFQKPQPANTPFDGSFSIIENAGISSVQFTGTATSAVYDINTSNLPSGGIIVTVGSTAGLGYQPLVSAGGTAVVSGLGTISSISIGNSGSGYRVGVQTVVNVGVAESSTGTPNIEFIGTAAISGGHIVSVAVTNSSHHLKKHFVSRASTATYLSDTTRFITTAAVDEARYENNQLLVEESSTNLIPTSSLIGIGVNQGITSSSPTETNPAGGSVSKRLVCTSGNSSHRLTVASSSSNTVTVSLFVKKDTHRYVNLGYGGLSNSFTALFDIDPTVTGDRVLGQGTRGVGTNISAGYENYPNDWVRIFVTGTTTGTNGFSIQLAEDENSFSLNNWVAVGDESIFVYGAQLEDNADSVSSLIITEGSTATRAADIIEYKAPVVLFDDPLSYSNIPLEYSSASSGIGSNATVDIVVGQGSSVIEFSVKNNGYGYGPSEILTVAIGGTSGIPTDTSYSFDEFQLTIETTQSDTFSGWSVGDLQVFDSIEDLFDGTTRTFPLSVNGTQTSIRSKFGSIIDIKATLLVFFNDVLQVPDQGYIFNGGSNLTFAEAPKENDTCKIVFYRGTDEVDVVDVDILESIKIGDNVRLNDDEVAYKEDERLVTDVVSTDVINTKPYSGPGVTQEETYSRSVIWCRQRDDLFIDGKEVNKDRIIYEPLIRPTTNITEHIGVGLTEIYVESVRTFFDNEQENSTKQDKITIISQNSKIAAAATAIVSGFGTISSINITNAGLAYSSVPSVTIGNPVGLGTTQRASADATISGVGTVSSITITSPGTGYTFTNPPVVIIEEPKPTTEVIDNVSYAGDFGFVVGYGISNIGVSTNAIFDFYIPEDSYLRDASVVGTAVTLSGIGTGDFFVINNSNAGSADTSISTRRTDDTVIGVSTQYADGIYQVSDIQILQKEIVGIGTTTVTRIFSPVVVDDSTYSGSNSISTSNYHGDFTWGKIYNLIRSNPQQFSSYGYTGITTSPVVVRTNPLGYINYIT